MREKVYFEDSKGNKVCGILNNLSEDKQKPIVILCHGFTSNKDSVSYDVFDKALTTKDISYLKIDFFGHGESEGNFSDVTLSKGVDDALSAIKFIKDKGYTKIGFIGTSFGGAVGLITAIKSKDLFVLGLKCPVSDYYGKYHKQKNKEELKQWRFKGYVERKNNKGEFVKLNYSFYEDILQYKDYQNYEKIKIPTLIIHGELDESVPVEQSRKTCSIILNCKLVVIKDADHYLSGPGEPEKIADLLADFIVENLKEK